MVIPTIRPISELAGVPSIVALKFLFHPVLMHSSERLSRQDPAAARRGMDKASVWKNPGEYSSHPQFQRTTPKYKGIRRNRRFKTMSSILDTLNNARSAMCI
ncbi:hypothetical protein TNCV_880231 [Trichonephila clavipes]|nr:hypothetical protein TNCV_880231 [Trichonephila clavipes]